MALPQRSKRVCVCVHARKNNRVFRFSFLKSTLSGVYQLIKLITTISNHFQRMFNAGVNTLFRARATYLNAVYKVPVHPQSQILTTYILSLLPTFASRFIWSSILTFWKGLVHSYAASQMRDVCPNKRTKSCQPNYWDCRWVVVFLEVLYYSPLRDTSQGLVGRRLHVYDLVWWMSFLSGAQFTASRCQWWNGNS
jgi:hypothetical protein